MRLSANPESEFYNAYMIGWTTVLLDGRVVDLCDEFCTEEGFVSVADEGEDGFCKTDEEGKIITKRLYGKVTYIDRR